jgi:hypothetical protein
MVRDKVVDIAEKRYFVSPDYPDDFLYPVVELSADIDRFPQPCRDVRFPDKQGFIFPRFSIQFICFHIKLFFIITLLIKIP